MARRQQERERMFKEREKLMALAQKDAREREEAHALSIAGSFVVGTFYQHPLSVALA